MHSGDSGLCLPGLGRFASGLQEEAQVAQPPRPDGQGIHSSFVRLLPLPSLLLVSSIVTGGQPSLKQKISISQHFRPPHCLRPNSDNFGSTFSAALN